MKPEKVLPGKPAEVEIYITRNDTFQWRFRGWSKDGTPFNFDSYFFRMQIKEDPDDSEEDALVDIPNNDFNKDWDDIGENADRLNIIRIEHDKDNMDLEEGSYYFDIEMTSPDQSVRQTIYRGTAHVEKDTTRYTL